MFQQVISDIKANGGATWHWSRPVPTSGYVVSLGANFAGIVSESVLDNDNDASVTFRKFVEQNDGALAFHFLGAWTDAGKLYLDVVEVIESENDAIRAGIERNQISIYNLATGETIATGGTGEI